MNNAKTKRLVIKLGTNVLTDAEGNLDLSVIESTCNQVAQLRKEGYHIVLVSSGAVGAGKSMVSIDHSTTDTVTRRQVYSAVGQVKLMNLYTHYFGVNELFIAQVLATKEDFTGLEHYKNMKNCFNGILNQGLIPIVNENDVVSLDELMFTDNDELAGLTSFMVEAEQLIILTNVEGVFTGDPSDSNSQLIQEVQFQEKGIEKYFSTEKSSGGRGGIQSKYDTATRCAEKGIVVTIANGKKDNVISRIINNEKIGTRFLAKQDGHGNNH